MNMPDRSDVLELALLPVQAGKIILPSAALVEVLPYAPTLALENAPPWLVGTLLWGASTAPLISFDALFTGVEPRAIQHRRIILLQAPTAHPRLYYFGFLATAPPEWANVERRQLARDDSTDELPLGALCRVRLDGQTALIPDLDALERMLLKILRR